MYHKVGDKLISDKGKWYQDKAKRPPKEGARAFIPESERAFDSNYQAIWGTHTCEVCGAEVLFKQTRCDEHKGQSNG